MRTPDPIEDLFLGRLKELKRVERRLRKPFWGQLKRSAPKTYASLIRSIISDTTHKALIEEVEEDLCGNGLSWANLKAIGAMDENSLGLGQHVIRSADELTKSHIREWRRYDSAVKLISSEKAPFTEGLKRRLVREHNEIKRLDVVDRRAAKILRRHGVELIASILGGKPRPRTMELKHPLRRLHLWNVMIVRIASQLISAGFSKNMSFILTDRILHLLCPHWWPEPDEFSHDWVRQRYYYWSKRRESKRFSPPTGSSPSE